MGDWKCERKGARDRASVHCTAGAFALNTARFTTLTCLLLLFVLLLLFHFEAQSHSGSNGRKSFSKSYLLM